MSHTEEQPYPYDAEPPSVPPLNEQMTMLGRLVANGQYERIVPKDFPDISLLDLAMSRFIARNTAINSLLGLADTAQDGNLKRKLNVTAGNLIAERDHELSAALGDVPGEPNKEVLARQRATSSRDTDEFPLLMQLTGMGLVDEITPARFPHMATMHPRTRARLAMLATGNDIAHLEGARQHVQSDPAFKLPTTQDPSAQDTSSIHRGLGDEISARKRTLSKLAKSLVTTRARRTKTTPPNA